MGDKSRALAGEIFAAAVLQFGENLPDAAAGTVAGRLFDLVLSATEKAAMFDMIDSSLVVFVFVLQC